MPAPSAGPLTAAITGLFDSMMREPDLAGPPQMAVGIAGAISPDACCAT